MEYKKRILNNKTKIIRINKIQEFMLSVFACLNILWIIVQILDYFFVINIWKNYIVVGIIILATSFILPVIFELITWWKRKVLKETYHDSISSLDEKIDVYNKIIDKCIYDIDDDILLKCIISEFNKSNWEEVIKVGKISSELYWRIARYELRIKNGEYVLKAIEQLRQNNGDKQYELLEARTYIDDIGYTLAELDIDVNAEVARENINKGKEIAERLHDSYLITKANRHLSGTYLKELRKIKIDGEEKKAQMCKEYYEKAIAESENIVDGYEKKRMKAFLKYLHGNILLVTGSPIEAIGEFNTSKKEFERIHDYGSAVKIFYCLGQIYELQEDKTKSIETYKQGFDEAEKLERNDQVLKNGFALCQLLKEKDKDEFVKYYTKIYQLANELGNKVIIEELNQI